MWKYDTDRILQEKQSERKNKFLKIGEDVYSFFQYKATAAGFEEREG